MPGLSLRGPNRLGASDLDEGALTVAVVNSYAQTDGSDGAAVAAKVLPARRHLWRLLEVHAPRALAAALRARLLPADQTGRGGVRDLRRAVADWLDPPTPCHRCGRPITEETSLIACPKAKPRGVAPAERTNPRRGLPSAPPRTCSPASGPRARRSLAGANVRNGTLSLFSPVQLDPACAAAQKLLKHGGAAWYDIACDRDGRILHAASDFAGQTTHRARLVLDRAVDLAIKANGRLILNTQLRFYSPRGGTTRADLVQGGAMGCRRALMDFDPALARFSTYAINWIRQGIGESFADRDLVPVPEWAAGLRREVEDRGVMPGPLLADIVAVAEVRLATSLLLGVASEAAARILACLDAPFKVRDTGVLCVESGQQGDHIKLDCAWPIRRQVSPLVLGAERIDFNIIALSNAATTDANVNFLHAWHSSTTQAVVLAANRMPGKAKLPITDERSQEQVALVFARAMNLECTGGALLTALRYGAASIVSVVGTGESDGDDARDGDPHASTPDRAPLHLRTGNQADDCDDPEALAAEEDAATHQWRRTVAALEAVRAADPEAAEVVRRRHALDRLGDPETLEEIAAAPLQSTRRELCRESVRKAYVRGTRAMQAVIAGGVLPALLPAAATSTKTGRKRRDEVLARAEARAAGDLPAAVFPLAVPAPDDADDGEYTPTPRRPHGPFRPRRPERVVTTYAVAVTQTTSDAPQAVDLGAWTAAMDAAAGAF